MLRLLNIIWLLLFIGLLSGCMPRQNYTYTPPEGKAARACSSHCKIANNSCMQLCALKNSTCRSEMESKATERFVTYKHQRQAKGLPVEKSYEKFLKTSSCAHSCNCIPAYNTCYSACGGSVY